MRYDESVSMSTERTITFASASALLLGLALLGGCKGGDAPRTTVAARQPRDTVTSASGSAPFYEGLIQEYRTVLAGDPNNLAANIAMGNALYDAGKWKEAITYYDQALRLNPHNADVVTDMGTCYRNLGMADAAVREYTRALRIDPAHQNALYNLGIVYSEDKKDPARAIPYWERLLEIAPKHPQAQHLRSSLENLRRTLKRGAQ